jgi:hypothetical protein
MCQHRARRLPSPATLFTSGAVGYGDAARPAKREADMALLIIEHVVGDYETFKEVFLEDQERRRRSGSRGARVWRVDGDPNNIRVVLEFETAEQARTHAEGLELREAIKWATGNVSMPSFVVLEHLMDTDA